MGFYLRDNPCKGCTKRNELCHSNCSDYIEWKQTYTAFKEEEVKEKEMHIALNSVHKNKKNKNTEKGKFRNKSKLYRIVHDNKIGE